MLLYYNYLNMKLFFAFFFLFFTVTTQAQVGIGTTTPAASAKLDISSTSKGLLIPRVALTGTTDAVTISSPAVSLLVYNTTANSYVTPGYYYNSGTSGSTLWVRLVNEWALDTKLNKTDTASLSTRIHTKLDKWDTASLSNRIDTKLTKWDTASLSNRIDTKLNSSVIDLGILTGAIIYWDESLRKFRILAPGADGQVLKIVSGIPAWRADATTSTTAFSPCGTTITDIDGNSYNTVLIGSQCWTKENLRVRRYNDGTAIQFDATGGSGGSSSTWQNLTIGAHTIYGNDITTTPSNLTKYGYLYNWYAAKGIYTTGTITATDTLNVCPVGWHVPTDAEWTTLITELGGESVAGGKMKSIGTAYWNSPNTGATNESGFSALPGGYRNSSGSFESLRDKFYLWSGYESSGSNAWIRYLSSNDGSVIRVSNNKSVGASVRCIRD
jgi:uncharacterized protein (TIGR02145 family)